MLLEALGGFVARSFLFPAVRLRFVGLQQLSTFLCVAFVHDSFVGGGGERV